MGRTLDGVQKRRKSAPKSSNSTISHGDLEEFDWTLSSSMSISTNQTDPFSNAMANPELDRLTTDSMTLWDESRSLQQHDLGSLDPSREPPGPGFGSLIGDLGDMDFGDVHSTLLDVESPLNMVFPQLIRSPSPRPSTQQQRQARPPIDTAPSTPIYPHSTTSKLPDAMHSVSDVNSWTTLLEKLSPTPYRPPIALDELLHNSSTLLPRVTQALRSLPSDSSCMAPLILILLCLTQTISLFEQCIPSVIHGLAACGSRDLSLHLGAFQVDREAQQALQKHIVGKELSRILHVSKLVKQALQQPGLVSVPKRTHSLLIDDLQVRIKSLVYLVKERWNAA